MDLFLLVVMLFVAITDDQSHIELERRAYEQAKIEKCEKDFKPYTIESKKGE